MVLPALLLPAVLVSLAIGLCYLVTPLEPGSGDRVRRRRVASGLAHELPYWQIDDDGTVLGVDGSYAAGLALSGIDTDCLSDADLDGIDRQLHTLLQVLPAGCRLQWMFLSDRPI